jgi:ferritin
MLSKRLQEALNAQINAEYYSSYMYLAMAAYAESVNLKGFANWFRIQSQEEMIHVMKFFGFVIDRRGQVELQAIEAPPSAWDSPLAVFEATLKHEQYVTSLINRLMDVSHEEHDNATLALLQWFINEQVEEEAAADEIVQNLKLIGNEPSGLYLLDRDLATRVFVPPPAAGAAAV